MEKRVLIVEDEDYDLLLLDVICVYPRFGDMTISGIFGR